MKLKKYSRFIVIATVISLVTLTSINLNNSKNGKVNNKAEDSQVNYNTYDPDYVEGSDNERAKLSVKDKDENIELWKLPVPDTNAKVEAKELPTTPKDMPEAKDISNKSDIKPLQAKDNSKVVVQPLN